MRPFHLAFPVRDTVETREFYTEVLGCSVGREDERWIDLNFYGHQLSAHRADEGPSGMDGNEVDDKLVPVRHFGVVLEWDHWEKLAERLRALNVPFYIEPYIRFAGLAGEQGTMFIRDPSGNFLEFKSFKDPRQLFAK